ncbi:MAG: ATP-dependent Clp protease proteolytic subunit [Anaerolineae bacterium]|nr:ATP-dependent Clp protease proteolytic subunit [Anaerolineae bacterium]
MNMSRKLYNTLAFGNSGMDRNDTPRLTVETVDNHIYFYADVDSDRCLALMRAIRNADTDLRTEHLSRGLEGTPLTPIWLHIHSYGGDLFTGFSMADQLKMIKTPIYSVVEGICASAATLIAMSCVKRYILPSSFVLIHQLSGFVWGTHEQFKDEMTLQNKAMDRLVQFYAAHSKTGEEQIRSMLTRDFWMDAETCVEMGFADEVLR